MGSKTTKGPSNLYGNDKHEPTDKINYPYAKQFNQSTLVKHQEDHGRKMGLNSITDYEESAIRFANNVSTVADSFVDENGTTYKYNYITNKLIIVGKNGMIISYFKPAKKELYYLEQKNKKEVKK